MASKLRPQQADGLFYQGGTEIGENLHFFKKRFAPEFFNVKIFRVEDPRNRCALTLQNMCINGVGDTFSFVLFLHEVVRGRQNAIFQQN